MADCVPTVFVPYEYQYEHKLLPERQMLFVLLTRSNNAYIFVWI